MYSKHFNLDENPFSIAPDPRYLYMSEKHREALAHLLYGLETDGGFVLLTGEVGTGKTTVCRCLLEQLPENITIALVLNPKLTSLELLATICDELGIDYSPDQTTNKTLVDKINRYLLEKHAEGRKTVLIIDEAQNLEIEVLEQLRLLTNLETNQRKLLQVIILGQPELRDILAKPEMRQLAQRITARFHLGPLHRNEVGPYISHRLAVAGHRKKLFSDRVIGKIYEMTGGIPRLINVLCDRCLLGTYVQGREIVNSPTLKQAGKEVFGKEKKPLFTARPTLLWLGVIATVCAAAILLNYERLIPMNGDGDNTSQNIVGESPNATDDPVKTKESSLRPEQAPSMASGTVELVWPDEIPRSASLTLGYRELFSRWGKTYAEESELPICLQAREQGLDCLHRKGSLGGLSHLDRPALLKMVDRNGAEFFAPLVKLGNDQATFIINGEERSVPAAVLDRQWFGAHTILWQPPPEFDEVLRTDSESASSWLREKLALITGEDLADRELLPVIRAYQSREGLIADGIVGPETIIHINSSTGNPGPRLKGN
ncbi:MAG: AAA family ATPase [Proteobacteria bacterium]|nr:AAA family ATPase [Pseudomonadota bacterium]MBU1738980.1 AAA family ATPase [Pseudomonadota bacterium]